MMTDIKFKIIFNKIKKITEKDLKLEDVSEVVLGYKKRKETEVGLSKKRSMNAELHFKGSIKELKKILKIYKSMKVNDLERYMWPVKICDKIKGVEEDIKLLSEKLERVKAGRFILLKKTDWQFLADQYVFDKAKKLGFTGSEVGAGSGNTSSIVDFALIIMDIKVNKKNRKSMQYRYSKYVKFQSTLIEKPEILVPRYAKYCVA